MIRRPRAQRSCHPKPAKSRAAKPELSGDDKIVRVGDMPVTNYRELASATGPASRSPAAPDRRTTGKERRWKRRERSGRGGKPAQELTFELPPQPAKGLGLAMKMGPDHGDPSRFTGRRGGFENRRCD